jgi:predicted acylesterase/phospholipase RssA
MLTLDPACGRTRSGGSIGLALAGGGPLGAFYELGALHALGEAVDGLDLTALDVYVGVSSGSMVAAALANGFDTTSLGSIFINNDSSLHPFAPSLFARPAVREYIQRARRLPALLAQALGDYARDPIRAVWAGAMEGLSQAVPVAAFDNAPIGSFIEQLLRSAGHTDDFRRLRAKLFVVATNLNTGTSVRFGEPGFDAVPISRAVMASTALPGLYPPVDIDGQSYVDGALIRTMNASLAFEAGCQLVICINPLVVFDASRASDGSQIDLSRAALPTILSQTFRALIQSRMHVGMASYRTRFPQADLLLLEPDRDDKQMFFVNVFRYRERQRLVNHAYQRTRADLLRHADALEPVLARHGLALRRDVLGDRRRTFATAIRERADAARRVTRNLAATLDRLESTLHRRGVATGWSRARGGR